MFIDPRFWLAVYNTVWYVAAAVVPQVFLALLLALLLNQKVRGITFFRTIFFMPSIVPIVASVALFIFILHDCFGLLNETLFQLFGIVGPQLADKPRLVKTFSGDLEPVGHGRRYDHLPGRLAGDSASAV